MNHSKVGSGLKFRTPQYFHAEEPGVISKENTSLVCRSQREEIGSLVGAQGPTTSVVFWFSFYFSFGFLPLDLCRFMSAVLSGPRIRSSLSKLRMQFLICFS